MNVIGQAITLGGGVGGAELVIVGGITKPSKATQNTIWIRTNIEITSTVLSAVEPTNPIYGMVWLTIADSGSNHIIAPVGDNWITVYPTWAKQYIEGVWVDKVTGNYRDGVWFTWWDGTLYDAGNEYTDITGGWKSKSGIVIRSGAQSVGTATKNATNLYVTSTAASATGAFTTVNKINLTGFSRITFHSTGNYGGIVVAAHQFETGVLMDAPAYSSIDTSPFNLDISGLTDGEYYISIAGENSSRASFTKIQLS